MQEKEFGRYQLRDLLGRGGMGHVYRAFDTETDRLVAVKVLPPQLAEDPAYQQRFRREARTAAGLNDPHIVPIHDYGEIDGRLYVDMRLIDGLDLGVVIAESGGRLNPVRAVPIIEQVAAALDTAHRAGLIHRDIKPSNILIAAHDFAYLIDFGIARAADDTAMTNTGQTVGTLAYMAPERFNGAVDPRSDVYALTCVLHECLTGQRPYPGDSLEQQLAGHLSAPPPQPSSAGLPAPFDAVIARGLAKNPDQRYQTATELAAAARAALHQPAGAMPPPLPAARRTVSAPRWAARTLLAMLATVTAGYLALLGTGVDWATPAPSIAERGGTRVTLTARTPDGSAPTRDALSTSQQIIRSRAAALGLRGTTVDIDGDTVVITVPGTDGAQARALGQTALLYLRPVIESLPAEAAQVDQPGPPGMPGAPEPAPPGQPRPFPQNPTPVPQPADPAQTRAQRLAKEKELRQSTNTEVQYAVLQREARRCATEKEDVLAGNDDPALPLVTCSTDHQTAYLLGPSIISGDQIADANSGMNQQKGGYVVDLRFTGDATDIWGDYTAAHIGSQAAFTLDSQVVSAPTINEAIRGGRTEISGNFTQQEARDLAANLRSKALPLSFESSEAVPVPPSNTGMTRRAMLIAGAVGLEVALAVALLFAWRRPRGGPASPVSVRQNGYTAAI